MKKIISTVATLCLIIALMPLTISEVNADLVWADVDCIHLQHLGQGLEWTPYDEGVGVSVLAFEYGGLFYYFEQWEFRRVVGYGYGYGAPGYAEEYFACYMYVEYWLNEWPYEYDGDWTYGWIDNPGYPTNLPTGQNYYYQDYYRSEQYMPAFEIWGVAESWFFDPYETEWWLCSAIAHLPGGY